MEQCPFCREPDRFVRLLDNMQSAIRSAERDINSLKSEIHGMARVETHMHYLAKELSEFKSDRRQLYSVIKALTSYVKKTGILP
jgi:acyl carrier protein phosphodiesterase